MLDERPRFVTQSAVLPYRWGKDGVQVLLVTSKGTKRWVLPKGGVKPGLAPYESAAEEAFEEAGVVGHVARNCIGVYLYGKTGAQQRTWCQVKVYPMKVIGDRHDWPERHERRRRWMSFAEAALSVREKALKRILLSFHANLVGKRD